MPSTRKSSAGFWITVALVAVLLYPLSLGPVNLIDSHGWLPPWAKPLIEWFYWPIYRLYYNGPKPIARLIRWYSDFWWNVGDPDTE